MQWWSWFQGSFLKPAASEMVTGDAYLFDEEVGLVGTLGGLRFQCILRKLFNTFLPTPKPSSEATPSQKARAQAPIKPKKHVETRQQISVAVKEARVNEPSTADDLRQRR